MDLALTILPLKSASLRALVAVALAVPLLLAPAHAQLSQQQAQQPQVQGEFSTLIRTISVRGNQRIESETLRSYLPVEAGMFVDQLTIDSALKSLFATGLFEDAQINFDGRRGVLEVVVQENPIVNRIVFIGNKRTDEDKFTEEIELEPRAVYTRAKAQADAQRIIEVYRRSGRFGATVTPKIKRLAQNRVDVVYEIDEGPKTGVKSISFLGNEAFSDAELRGAILTAPSKWWNILESNDNYDPDRLEYDRELLRQFYSKNGYADFSVTSAVAELTPDRNDFIITFEVDEGPLYKFGKVDVNTTLSKLPGYALRARIPIREGTTFNSELMEKAEEALTFATGVAGYAFVDVNPRLDRNPETKTVDVTFDVNEGPRVYVEEININGNTQTLDHVIRREMRIIEGDAFNRVLIDRSERRVKGLGFFSEVTVEEEAGSAPDRTVLNVNVEEQPTGAFQIGGGVSSNDNFIFNVSVEQRNLLGRGQYVLLDLQAAQRTNRVQLSITEPWFLGRRLRAGASVFLNETDFEEAGFVSNSVGTNFNVGFPVSEFSSLLLNYGLRWDNLELTTSQALPPDLQDASEAEQIAFVEDNFTNPGADIEIIPIRVRLNDGSIGTLTGFRVDRCDVRGFERDLNCERNGEFLTSQVGYTLRMDRTNDPIVPSAGWDLAVSQGFAGLGGNVNFHRTTIRGGVYKRLPLRLIGAIKLNAGYIDSFNNDGIRTNDRFFLGGNRGFRGFDVAGVGPRLFGSSSGTRLQGRGQAVGARAYAITSTEALLPLPLPPSYGIRASLFMDAGYIGLTNERDQELFNGPGAPFVSETGQPLGNFFGDPVPPECDAFVEVDDFDGFAQCADGFLDLPLQDDFLPRVTAGISVNWNSPFGPVQIDLSEALVVEDYDRPQSFRFSAGGRF
ncbi:MAG: outer membrane protein assembly factor BamA [Pseudomonadota bacterium]